MIVVRHETAGKFLERAGAWLETAEAENNLILGIAFGLQKHSERCEREPYFLTVEDNSATVGTAIMTLPHHLVIVRSPEAALKSLADWLIRQRVSIPGALGPKDEANKFAHYWASNTGKSSRPGLALRMSSCFNVVHPTYSYGKLRVATIDDKSVLVQWCRAFTIETGVPESPDNCDDLVPGKISDRSLYVWEDGQVVTMAGLGGDTAHGIRVGSVYTTPALRGKGYATSCVAALTQRMLDSGKRFCCLYIDLANPTSNSIYRRIGYESVCDCQDWFFDEKE
jgi:uncharacterized protein